MSRQELESYARDGELPPWFSEVVGDSTATQGDSQEGENAD